MKRFFQIFSILLVVFLALTAGCLAVLQYGSIQTYSPDPLFVRGWGITAIPYNGSRVEYPNGDLYLVQQYAGQVVNVNSVVLLPIQDKSVHGIMSGLVTGIEDGKYLVEAADGSLLALQPTDVEGVYAHRVRGLVSLLRSLSSPLSIVVLSLVLAASIAFWRLLPGKPEYAGLSHSDDQISSNLY